MTLSLDLNGQQMQALPVSIGPNGTASVTFAPFTVSSRNMRATVRLPPDALARDNVFHFVVSPGEPVRTVVVNRAGAERESLYLLRALSIGDTPRVEITERTSDTLSDNDLRVATVVILNDVPVSDTLADRLARFVIAGGGLLFSSGPHASWPAARADVLPGLPGAIVERTSGPSARLGALEYSHPVFELFRAPRSGDFSSARFYSYRAIDKPVAPVLARYDDGTPALMERKAAEGRVLLWTSTIDLGWNDLPLKPVFLPFVHTVIRYLSDYAEPPSSQTVGQVVPALRAAHVATSSRGATIALAPSGARLTLGAEDGAIELGEQGFYEVRTQGAGPETATVLASNVDLSESDLTAMDPRELIAAVIGRPATGPNGFAEPRPTDDAQAQAQRLWWYLLVAGGLLLAAETLLSNQLTGVS